MGKIEEAMGRNLQGYVAACQQMAPEIGADCIEVAGGVVAFTGIGSPLTTVKGTGPQISPRHLQAIESFFRDHQADSVTIEVAPWLTARSKGNLGERRYRVAGREDVVATTSGSTLASDRFRMELVPAHEWPELMHGSYELPEESSFAAVITAAAHLPDAQLYGIREHDRWIACAQSASYGDVVVFGNDGTRSDARHRGAQTALIRERLRVLPHGTIVTAEVDPASGSERNYLRCGFRIAYSRTHYIVDL